MFYLTEDCEKIQIFFRNQKKKKEQYICAFEKSFRTCAVKIGERDRMQDEMPALYAAIAS